MPGACELAEWNVPHAPHEHRSLLIEIDEDGEEGLAEQQIFTRAWAIGSLQLRRAYFASNSFSVSPCVAQPRIAGTSAQYPPSSASCTTTLIFISNPHRHHDVPVLKPIVAGIFGTHLAGGLGVFELQPHVAAIGGLEEIE